MAISSINFAKSSSGSFAHNDRTEKEPDYLLPVEHRLENECNRSAPEAQKMLEDLFENAKENYSKTYGQKFQTKFENVHWEAEINLNKEHTIKDVERLVRAIEKETGFTAVQISIHRDEGRINEKTGHPVHNLHAHVNFFTLDPETGQQLYRRSISNSERERIREDMGIPKGEPIPKHLTGVMDKAKLSKLQDITAETLGMERGEKGSKAVRLGHKQYRVVAQEKEKLLEKIEELQKENTELRYSFRDMQKQITALEGIDAEQKKELHRLNTEANKTKDQDEKDEKIKELIEQIITREQTIDQLKSEKAEPPHEPINARMIANLQSEKEMLQIEKRVLEREVTELKENRTAVDVSKEIEETHTQIVEMARVATSNAEAIEELEKAIPTDDPKKVAIAVYNSHIVPDTGFMGKLGGEKKDEALLIENMAKEIQKRDNLLKRFLEQVKKEEITKMSISNAMKNVVESTKKHLESVFSKITGKSISEAQKERTELLNAQKERERLERQKEDRGKGMER